MRVTFCGHAEIADYDTVRQWLSDVADDLIAAGADSFYLGGYGAFDSLCAAVLRQKKQQAPQIETVLVLTYPDSNMMTEAVLRLAFSDTMSGYAAVSRSSRGKGANSAR